MSTKILKNTHDSMKELHDIGLIDTITMREFDALCLPPVEKMPPRRIQRIRAREKVSQPVFAQFLNVSDSTVKKWETGEKTPNGAALRLLNIVEQNGLDVID